MTPAASVSRVFPAATGELYRSPSLGATADERRARAILALAGRPLTPLQRLAGVGCRGANLIGRMLHFHRLGLEAELSGRRARADFFWRSAKRALASALRSPGTWANLIAAMPAEPDSHIPPEGWGQLIAEEVFLDTHWALMRGYLDTNDEPESSNRAFQHLAYVRSIADLGPFTTDRVRDIIGRYAMEEIEACGRDGQAARARISGADLLRRFPEETAFQNAFAEACVKDAKSRMSNQDKPKACLADATILSRTLYDLKKLRIEYPHNASIFGAIATLHHLRAQRLVAAERLAEALAETQAAAAYASDLWPEQSKEIEQTRAALESEMQKLRIQASAPEAERPVLSSARARLIQQQAAKGFRLADAFKHSDEARIVDEDAVVAGARRIWEEIGLGSLERADLRPVALKDAVEAVQAASPPAFDAVLGEWNRAAMDNSHLASLDSRLVTSWIASGLFGSRFERTIPFSPVAAPAALPAKAEVKDREPSLYWLFSPENKWLKVQCALAVVLMLAAGIFGWREWNNRKQRDAAYSDLRRANQAGDSLRVLDSAELFLSRPVMGRDARVEQVRDFYSEALVRWFHEQPASDPMVQKRLDRYRQLMHIAATPQGPAESK